MRYFFHFSHNSGKLRKSLNYLSKKSKNLIIGHLYFLILECRPCQIINQTTCIMKSLIKILLLIAIILLPISSYGQINVNFKKKVINQTNSRANHAADKTISKGLDAVEDGVTDAITGDDEKDKDKADNSSAESDSKSASDNQSESAKSDGSAKQDQQTLQTYSRYDFMPGEKIIFYEDFTQDAVGDFPALWNTNGSAEIVTTNLFPGNWMKFDCSEAIWTDALLTLPDNYTIEFDVVPTKGSEGSMSGYSFRLMQCINPKSYDHGAIPGKAAFCYSVEYFGRPGYRTYINSDEGEGLGLTGYKEDDGLKQKEGQKYHMALWYQKGRVRLYQDQNKLFDLPKAFAVAGVKMDRLRFEDGAAIHVLNQMDWEKHSRLHPMIHLLTRPLTEGWNL